jgi:DNA-binding transcriptional LysR family regulator
VVTTARNPRPGRVEPFLACPTAPISIELRHLRYFLAVSEELHFGRAAERLHIAQPPLSQAIRRLEDELGVQLLHRTSRVVTMTQPGTVFAQEARKALAAVDLAVAEARRASGAGSALRIGCLPHLPIERLLRFLGALHERDPSMETHVTHSLTLEQVRRLRDGELDIGIFDYAGDYADIATEALFAGEPLCAFLASSHKLAPNAVLGPADLKREVLVTFPLEANPALHARLLALLDDAGYRFAKVHEAAGKSARDLILAVAECTGIALARSSLRDVSSARGIVVERELDPPVFMPDTVVAWSNSPPRHLETVLAVVREIARELRRATGRETAEHGFESEETEAADTG